MFDHNKEISAAELASLSKIIIPNGVIGAVERFTNYDPERIRHYEMMPDHVVLYMSELDRLEAIQQYTSTLQAFKFEVDRGKREETMAFHKFEYNDDFSTLQFFVDRELFEKDITAMMIELSIVEDILKYQLYSRKNVGVKVKYKDYLTSEKIAERVYPQLIDEIER